MISFLNKKLRFYRALSQNEKSESSNYAQDDKAVSLSLEENLASLKGILADSSDLVVRRFIIGIQEPKRAAVIYIDGMVDKALLSENVLKPLMLATAPSDETEQYGSTLEFFKSKLIFAGSIDEITGVNEIVSEVLSGDTALLIDGTDKALKISLRGWKHRNVEEPKTETVVRGSREGFSETLRVNTSMLRRRIKNPDLVFETVVLGERTKTPVCVAYIRGLAERELIDEIYERLARIKTDAILESGYIEQFIEDAPFSIFSTVANSEKPDKVAAKLLEGRAALLIDGSPFVLTVPTLFIESFQSSEDYYSRPFFASLVRLIRYIAYLINILAPAMYVALTSFHQELIPTPLLLSMAAAREGVPFPAVVEAALMLLFFEILKEAGVRLPRQVGQAVSIVGALVIGEAAVSAGLIGAPMVILVAVTAVSSFVVPSQTDSGAIIRLILLLLAGVLGGFGIAIGLFVVLIHLASLQSFGMPFLTPLAPYFRSEMKDAFVRAPIRKFTNRPVGMAADDVRQSTNVNYSRGTEADRDFVDSDEDQAMKFSARIMKTLICILVLVSLCGCWNRRELNELGIVMGVGIDKAAEAGKVQVTTQVIRAGNMAPAGNRGGGMGLEKPYWNISDNGDTVFSTIRDMTNQSSRKLFFPHNQVLIYGQSIAEEGLNKYLDFFFRDPETRLNVYILVAEDSTKDIFEVKPELEELPAFNIKRLVEGQAEATSQAVSVKLTDFKGRLMSKTTAPVAPIVKISGEGEEKVLEISGTAVFKDDKMVGSLNKKEGRGLMWVLGTVNSGIIDVQGPEGSLVSLETIRSKTVFKPEVKDGKVKIIVKISEEGNVGEETGRDDLTTESNINFLKKQKAEAIKDEVMAAVKKAQELDADIFGFGEAVHRRYPKEWKTMKKSWNADFRSIEVEVSVETELRLMGRISKASLSEQEQGMKLEKGIISNKELTVTLLAFMQCMILTSNFNYSITKQDTWLAVLAAFVLSLPMALIYTTIAKRFAGKNLVQLNEIIFGRTLGKFISAIYLWFFLQVVIHYSYFFNSFWITYIMPETPRAAFLILFILVCAYAVYKGIETIARCSFIFASIIIFMAIFIGALKIRDMQLQNFLPVLETSAKDFIQSTHIMLSILFLDIVTFLMIFPSTKDNTKIRKPVLIAMSINTVMLLFVVMSNIAVAGIRTTNSTSVSFAVTREIDIANFISRLDILVALTLLITVFMKVTISFYVTVLGTAQLLELRSYKPLVIPVAVLAMALASNLYASDMEQTYAARFIWPFNAVVYEVVLPVITLAVMKIRGIPAKRGENE